jgi:hypothetical protein
MKNPVDRFASLYRGQTLLFRNSEPVLRKEPSVDEFVADRCLHPAVGRAYPERGEKRARRRHESRYEVSQRRTRLRPSSKTPKKAFEKESGRRFVCKKRPENVCGRIRIVAPIGSELERHHNPETTPIPNETEKILIQNIEARKYTSRLVAKCMPSSRDFRSIR